MVYIQPELRRTRSRNAQNLSQAQQSMGVTPSERPEARPQVGGGVAPSAEGGFTPGGQQAPSRMTEYFQAQQQQRDMLSARGEDLRLAQMLSKALDPSMPKGFRQLGLKQVSQMLGVDPRGDRAKEMINTLSGLDPQSLEGVRRGIVQSTNDAQPGEVTQLTRGVLTGQVPPDQLLQMAQGALAPPQPTAAATAEEEASPSMLGGPRGFAMPSGGTDVVQAQSTVQESPTISGDTGARAPATRQLFDNVAPAAEPGVTRESLTSPTTREVIPELTSALGLRGRYRVQDLYDAGYTVPSDAANMRQVATDIRTSRTALVNSFTMLSQLASLVRGNPEALDYPLGINLPSTVTQMGEYVRGLVNLVGGEGQIQPAVLRRALDDKVEGSEGAIAAITNNVLRWYGDTGARIHDASETNARIRAIVVPLAFAMAAAEGQTGRHLSDKDVALQLERLGRSGDPQRFIAAMTETANLLHQQYNTRMLANLGRDVDIGPAISPEVASIWRNGGIIAPPGEELRQIPRSGPAQQGPPAPAPTAPAAPSGPGISLDIGGERTEMPSSPTLPGPTPTPPPRSQAPDRPPIGVTTTPRAGSAVQRSSPTLEESETSARQRLQEERDYLHETRYQQRRRLELSEAAEARATRQEQEQKRQRIQQAFAQIGAALRGAVSGGGGVSTGGMGGEQDPNAFRITPPPQRRPPTPVQAAPFQPQPPQQRRRR